MYKVSPALAPAVYVPGLAYEALVRLRNRLYSAAILRKYRLPAPVISVGNITLGGSGKTPLVIYIAQLLVKHGHTPAILTRGYGRNHPGETRIIAPGETVHDAAAALGDEPALIQRHVPSAWLGISKSRLETGKDIAGQDSNVVFVLDDGFQHRKLHRDLDVVIIDESQPLSSNRVFPRGTLREPVSELHRCNVIVRLGLPGETDFAESECLNLNSGTPVFRCKQRIEALIPFHSWQRHRPGSEIDIGGLSLPESAYLVSALGNPERFQSNIRQMGIGGPGAAFFRDHHRLSRKDWQRCVEKARRKGASAIITTEKDAVKISEPPDFPLLVAIQTTQMTDEPTFETCLIKGSL